MASKKPQVDPCEQIKTLFTGSMWNSDITTGAWNSIEDLRADRRNEDRDEDAEDPIYEYRLVAVHRVTPVREEIK